MCGQPYVLFSFWSNVYLLSVYDPDRLRSVSTFSMSPIRLKLLLLERTTWCRVEWDRIELCWLDSRRKNWHKERKPINSVFIVLHKMPVQLLYYEYDGSIWFLFFILSYFVYASVSSRVNSISEGRTKCGLNVMLRLRQRDNCSLTNR